MLSSSLLKEYNLVISVRIVNIQYFLVCEYYFVIRLVEDSLSDEIHIVICDDEPEKSEQRQQSSPTNEKQHGLKQYVDNDVINQIYSQFLR